MFGTIFNLVNKFDHSVGEPGPIGKVSESVQGKVSVLNPLSANPTKWQFPNKLFEYVWPFCGFGT